MNPLLRWRRQPPQRRSLFVEAGLALASAAWAVRRWEFRRLASTLGVPAQPGAGGAAPQDDDPGNAAAARHVVLDVRWALHVWQRLLPRQPTCLMQAVAGRRMLARRGIACDVVFGVSTTPPASPNGAPMTKLGAHAWLRHGAIVVTGAGEAERFQPIAVYRSPSAKARQP